MGSALQRRSTHFGQLVLPNRKAIVDPLDPIKG
jgi:hypothetical protein